MSERISITTAERDQAIEDLRLEKEAATKRDEGYVRKIEEQKRIIKKMDEELIQKDFIIAEKQAKMELMQQEIAELNTKSK